MKYLSLLLPLAACDPQGADAPAVPPPAKVACALGRDAKLASVCGVTRARQGGRTVLTLTAPDGGFRRVSVAPDGAVEAADGAQKAQLGRGPAGEIEVAIAADRYLLPANGAAAH